MFLNDRSLPEGISERMHIIQSPPTVCTRALTHILALTERTWYTAWSAGQALPCDCAGGLYLDVSDMDQSCHHGVVATASQQFPSLDRA